MPDTVRDQLSGQAGPSPSWDYVLKINTHARMYSSLQWAYETENHAVTSGDLRKMWRSQPVGLWGKDDHSPGKWPRRRQGAQGCVTWGLWSSFIRLVPNYLFRSSAVITIFINLSNFNNFLISSPKRRIARSNIIIYSYDFLTIIPNCLRGRLA